MGRSSEPENYDQPFIYAWWNFNDTHTLTHSHTHSHTHTHTHKTINITFLAWQNQRKQLFLCITMYTYTYTYTHVCMAFDVTNNNNVFSPPQYDTLEVKFLSLPHIFLPTCSLICTCLGSSENDLAMSGVRALDSWQVALGMSSSGTDPFFFMIPKPGSRDFLPDRGVYCVLQLCPGILRRTRGLEKRAGAAMPLASLNIVRKTLDYGVCMEERERERERERDYIQHWIYKWILISYMWMPPGSI